MIKISMSLAIGLSILPLVPSAQAGERYRNRPPVIVSSNLSAPWVTQLGGQPRRVGYPARQPVARMPSQLPMLGQPMRQKRGLFGQPPMAAQPVAMTRPRAPKAQIEPQFLPQMVAYETAEKPGTIVIDTNNRFLYLVEADGMAKRYGVGVGKPGFEWAGAHTITRKAEWPSWTPPSEMISREAAKGHYLPARMDGGPENPLGARAMYLGSTLYRIHGTNAPWSIGSGVSSGCIRMRNEDVTDLYGRVDVGTRVIVM